MTAMAAWAGLWILAAWSWTAPASCPDSQAVLEEVEGLAGAVPEDLGVSVAVTVEEDPWRAGLVLDLGEGPRSRRLEGESCTALAEAVAVVVAIAMAELEPPVSRVPVRPRPTLRPIRVRWPRHLTARVGLGGQGGAYPGGALQTRVAVGVRAGLWALEGEVWFRGAPGADVAGISFDSDGAGGAVRGCRELGLGRWFGFGCGVFELGAQRIRSDQTDSMARWWVAPGVDLGLGVRWPWGLELRAGSELRVPAVRPRLRVDVDPGSVEILRTAFRPDPVALGASIEALFQFP